jgi:hypothetical protein
MLAALKKDEITAFIVYWAVFTFKTSKNLGEHGDLT